MPQVVDLPIQFCTGIYNVCTYVFTCMCSIYSSISAIIKVSELRFLHESPQRTNYYLKRNCHFSKDLQENRIQSCLNPNARHRVCRAFIFSSLNRREHEL